MQHFRTSVRNMAVQQPCISDLSFGAFMQQPAKRAVHQKSGGAGGSIIGILEACESEIVAPAANDHSCRDNPSTA